MFKRLFSLSAAVLFPMALLATAVVCSGDTPSADSPQPTEKIAPAEKSAAGHEDFPYVIEFEQGLSQYVGHDLITINEIRGTSKDMQSGICRISGTYKLDSHDKATLAASVSARESKDSFGQWNSAQRIDVSKGSGTFTLLLPISVRGFPHVSFYTDGSGVSGVYIGTGESVLKQW
jgi:hypothetical protein